MKDFARIVLFALMIVFGITVVCCVQVQREQQIKSWAHENGYEVVEMSRVFNPFEGPFWRHKGDDLRRATLERDNTRRVSYFRFNIWGMDQAWKE